MRRSAHVVAPLLASAAASLLAGCHNAEMQRCVDANNRVVDSHYCDNLPQNNGRGLAGGGGGTGGYYGGGGYRYYYGGRGSFAPGSVAEGGSLAPAAGHSYSTSSGTARGGFGGSFGGGEGGGHGGGAGE